MGISDLSRYQTLVNGIMTQDSQLQQLAGELATQRKLNQPSDDPQGTGQVINISFNQAAITQYQQNQAVVQTNLDTEDSVETAVNQMLASAQSSAASAANSQPGDSTRTSAITEINDLLQQVVDLANTQVGSNYVFGGLKTDQPPMQATPPGTAGLVGTSLSATDGAVTVGSGAEAGVYELTTDGAGDVTLTNQSDPTQSQTITGVTNGTTALNFSTLGVTIAAGTGFTVAALNKQTIAVASGLSYQGDTNRPQALIGSGQTVSTNHTGDQIFGNTIAALQGTLQALQTGTSDTISSATTQLESTQTQVLGLQSETGVTLQTMQNTASTQSTQAASLSTQQGNIENINTAQVATQLLTAQTALSAAYEATSRVLGLSLANYLGPTA